MNNPSLLNQEKSNTPRLGLYLFLVPLFFWAIALFAISDALLFWIKGEAKYEQNILKEWLEEARVFRRSLPELIDNYRKLANTESARVEPLQDGLNQLVLVRREEIYQHLRALGEPRQKFTLVFFLCFLLFMKSKLQLQKSLTARFVGLQGFLFSLSNPRFSNTPLQIMPR